MELAWVVLLLGLMALSVFRQSVLIFIAIFALAVGLLFTETSSTWLSMAMIVIAIWASLGVIKTARGVQ